MALNLSKFKTDLKAALKTAQASNFDLDPSNPDTAKDKAMENLANAIAEQVDAYIKTATVSVTVEQGIAVSVEPSSGQGATTSTGSGSGSLS